MRNRFCSNAHPLPHNNEGNNILRSYVYLLGDYYLLDSYELEHYFGLSHMSLPESNFIFHYARVLGSNTGQIVKNIQENNSLNCFKKYVFGQKTGIYS